MRDINNLYVAISAVAPNIFRLFFFLFAIPVENLNTANDGINDTKKMRNHTALIRTKMLLCDQWLEANPLHCAYALLWRTRNEHHCCFVSPEIFIVFRVKAASTCVYIYIYIVCIIVYRIGYIYILSLSLSVVCGCRCRCRCSAQHLYQHCVRFISDIWPWTEGKNTLRLLGIKH